MKWVSARNLDDWAGTTGAPQSLSELVCELARASAPDAKDVRFPNGDSSSLPGYDGTIYSEHGSTYVPKGLSVWEFGTEKDYQKKADEDFAKRSTNPRGLIKRETAFVFCTPREWKKGRYQLTEWEADKGDADEWREVHFVDGSKLETWFGNNPAAAARMAHRLGWRPQRGVLSVDEAWDRYVSEFSPQLSETAVIAGRKDEAADLVASLLGQPSPIPMRYDSPDELIAFALAAIRTADDEIRKYLLARTLVIETEDGVSFFGNQRGLVFLAQGEAIKRGGLLGRTNPTLVPLGNDQHDARPIRRLVRPTRFDFAQGLESIMPEAQARKWAQVCSGSFTILQRHIPAAHFSSPPWAGDRNLIAAVLAGAWDSQNNNDKTIIANLADKDYDSYREIIRPFSQSGPIDVVGSVWQVRAPFDALIYLSQHVDEAQRARLKEAAIAVFAETDANLDAPKNEPFERADRFKHSEWLRMGLARTLLHIAVLTSEARLPGPPVASNNFINEIVREIPNIETDYRVLASLKDEFSVLMEAAPSPLLNALKHMLEGDGSRLAPIFVERGTWSPRAYHTGLLWGLETLAWDPMKLLSASRVLAKLAVIDPDGKLSNRPINSLREIFLPWLPHTNATSMQRLAVIDRLIAEQPDVAWQLLTKLLDTRRGVSFPTSKPFFRESGASEREIVTHQSLAVEQRELATRALGLVGTNADRWKTIFEELPTLHPDAQERAVELFTLVLGGFSPQDRHQLWIALRSLVARHKRYENADWALPSDKLSKLAKLVTDLEPPDLMDRAKILFDGHFPEVFETEDGDFGLRAVEKARRKAVEDLMTSRGFDGVQKLAATVKMPHAVAIAFVDTSKGVEEVSALLSASLKNETLPQEFLVALSSRAQARFGEPWEHLIIDQAHSEALTAEETAKLVAAWPDIPQTWDLVERLGPEVDQAYWKRKGAWLLEDVPAVAERATRKFMSVGRSTAALGAISKCIESLPSSLLFELLDRAIPEINAFADGPNALLVHDIEGIFKQLKSRSDIDVIELARREYPYLPMWRHREGNLAIHLLMAREPAFYVSVLSDVFPGSGQDEKDVSEQERKRAELGYQLLSSFKTVPGSTNDQVDERYLTQWIDEVRRLAAEAGRSQIADIYVGHLLAHAPHDPQDGAWPHAAIRAQIERIASDDVEGGIFTECYNMRGVHQKAMFEGGAQERDLAEKYKRWARASSLFPRTSSLLTRIAEGYDHDAEREDISAEQRRSQY